MPMLQPPPRHLPNYLTGRDAVHSPRGTRHASWPRPIARQRPVASVPSCVARAFTRRPSPNGASSGTPERSVHGHRTAARRPWRDPLAQSPAHLERQPVLREPLQDTQVPAAVERRPLLLPASRASAAAGAERSCCSKAPVLSDLFATDRRRPCLIAHYASLADPQAEIEIKASQRAGLSNVAQTAPE
jgi:hypothetical protein